MEQIRGRSDAYDRHGTEHNDLYARGEGGQTGCVARLSDQACEGMFTVYIYVYIQYFNSLFLSLAPQTVRHTVLGLRGAVLLQHHHSDVSDESFL